jgi:hypothetical protein
MTGVVVMSRKNKEEKANEFSGFFQSGDDMEKNKPQQQTGKKTTLQSIMALFRGPPRNPAAKKKAAEKKGIKSSKKSYGGL